MRQVTSGKGFEYGIVDQLEKLGSSNVLQNEFLINAKSHFAKCDTTEQDKIIRSAYCIVRFLINKDARIQPGNCQVRMQSDQAGSKGDVRDIIIESPKGEIGISAKNRNFAVKNPRLSDTIDFGAKWLGHKASQGYWDAVIPVFFELRELKKQKLKWRELPTKESDIYVPILDAFDKELMKIYDTNTAEVPNKLLHYLLGTHDFYKVAKINGTAKIQSFNINGTLAWGKKLPMPKTIHSHNRKDNSNTTSIFTFDQGWQISFRIHNASTLVEPSLKFDVQLIGLPQQLSTNEIDY